MNICSRKSEITGEGERREDVCRNEAELFQRVEGEWVGRRGGPQLTHGFQGRLETLDVRSDRLDFTQREPP